MFLCLIKEYQISQSEHALTILALKLTKQITLASQCARTHTHTHTRNEVIFRRVRINIEKHPIAYVCRSVRMSVHMYQRHFHWRDFREIDTDFCYEGMSRNVKSANNRNKMSVTLHENVSTLLDVRAYGRITHKQLSTVRTSKVVEIVVVVVVVVVVVTLTFRNLASYIWDGRKIIL